MPLTSVETYSEPEQLEAAYTAATVELTPTAPVLFEARVSRLELDRVWIQRVYEAAPRIKWAAQSPKRAFIRFQTEPGAELVTDGVPLEFNELIYHGKANRYYENSSGPIRYAAVSLPVEDLAITGSALAGCDLSPLCENQRIIPPPDALKRLRRLHAAAAAVAEHAPHVIRAAEAAYGLEQSLVEALVDCLSDRERRVPTRAQISGT